MPAFTVTDKQVAKFNEDGYLLVEGLFNEEEMDLLLNIGKQDQEKSAIVDNLVDAEGRESKLWLTCEVGDDIYTAICHSRRVTDTMDALLNDEVYLYHYKMMVKEPKVGGAWEWHQDYGYWYGNECLYPDMGSCMIAVDRASKENGCLQIIKGSHKLGRIEHGTYGTQIGADPDRVKITLEHLELEYCEMGPGTALFFHANLLHRSNANTSDFPRWSLVCCYNTKHNPTKAVEGHPGYSPMDRWDDDRVAEVGRRQWEAMSE
jgi:ectoine hydroxylase